MADTKKKNMSNDLNVIPSPLNIIHYFINSEVWICYLIKKKIEFVSISVII